MMTTMKMAMRTTMTIRMLMMTMKTATKTKPSMMRWWQLAVAGSGEEGNDGGSSGV